MKDETEIAAELAKIERGLASDQRAPLSYTASLVARAETLRWVLGMEPMFGDGNG